MLGRAIPIAHEKEDRRDTAGLDRLIPDLRHLDLDAVHRTDDDQTRELDPGHAHVGQRHPRGDGGRAHACALQEVPRQLLSRGAELLREDPRGAICHGIEALSLVGLEHVRHGDHLLERIPGAQALLLEDPPKLGVEAVEALTTEPLEDVIDGTLPHHPRGSESAIPDGASDDDAEGEADGEPPHEVDEHGRDRDAQKLNPRVQGRAVAGIVGGDAALSHHDDRQTEQREHHQLECAGELRDLHEIEEDEPDDHGDGEDDGDDGHARLAELPKDGRQQVVTTHGQGIAGGAHDPGVRHGGEREHRRHRQHDGPRPAVGGRDGLPGVGHRGQGRDQIPDAEHPHQDHHAEHVDDKRRGKRQKDTARQDPLGISHLTGDAGHLGHAHIGDEDQPRRPEDVLWRPLEHVGEGLRRHLGNPRDDEDRQDRQQTDHEPHLKLPAGLRALEIEPREGERETHGHGFLKPRRGAAGDDHVDVHAHPHERERGLQDQGQPGPKAADGTSEGSQAPIEEIVGPSGARHRRGELDLAEHGGYEGQPRESVGQHHRRPGLTRGEPWQQEEPRAQGGARGQRVNAEEAQLLAQRQRRGRRRRRGRIALRREARIGSGFGVAATRQPLHATTASPWLDKESDHKNARRCREGTSLLNEPAGAGTRSVAPRAISWRTSRCSRRAWSRWDRWACSRGDC